MSTPFFAKSVELPFSNKTSAYWAVPSERSDVQSVSYGTQAFRIASALVAGTGVFYSPVLFGKNPINTWYKAAATAEHAMPGAILSTFRVSEMLRPAVRSTTGIGPADILLSKLSGAERAATQNYLRSVMGIDASISGLYGLKFEPVKGTSFGSLIGYTSSGQSKVLASRIRAAKPGRIFESFYSVVEPGLAQNVRNARDVFGGVANTKWIPIPTYSKLRDIGMAARTYSAFAVQRLGELIERVGEEIPLPRAVGGSISGALKKVGIDLSAKRGPFTRTLFGYGGFAAKLGAGALVLSQLDALRNSESGIGRSIGFAGTTALFASAGARIAKRIGKAPGKGALIGALASSIQVLPQFNAGLKPGIGGMLTSLNQLRSRLGETFQINRLRRAWEANFPSITKPSTAIYMGLLGATAGYLGIRTKALGEGTLAARRIADIYPYVRQQQLELRGGSLSSWAQRRLRLLKKHPKRLAEVVSTFDSIVEQYGGIERTFGSNARYQGLEVAGLVRSRILSELDRPVVTGNIFSRVAQRFAAGARAGSLGSVLKGAGLLAGAWFLATGGAGTLETPDELAAIYSGKQLVPVRRGRAWEMGATPYEGCLTPDSKLLSSTGLLVAAENVKIDTVLISRSGIPSKVVDILPRQTQEQVFRPITSFDRSGSVSITGNHEVLVVKSIRAKDKSRWDKTEKLWTKINSVPIDNRYRLFVPYYTPETIINTFYIPSYINDLFHDRCGWFYQVDSMWSAEQDECLLTIGNMKPRSQERRAALERFLEQTGFTYSQARYRLGDLRKSYRNTGARKHYISSIEPCVKLDYDFGKLCGYYAAGGSVDQQNNSVLFAFNITETSYIDDVKDIIFAKFGVTGNTIKTSDNGISVYFCSSVLAKFISTVIPGTAKAHNKSLHGDILNAPEVFLYGFIDGVIKGDGSVRTVSSKNGYESTSARIKMAPVPLLKQIQLILLRLKIFSSLSPVYENDDGYNWQVLNIPAVACYKLNLTIPIKNIPANVLSNCTRACGFTELRDGFAVSIFNIEVQDFNGIVYDFQVENAESFLGAGFTMHNSDILYWRQHWYPRLVAKARAAGTADRTPIGTFLAENFSYELELENYETRPYSISGAAFDEIPFIYHFIRPFSELIKPPRLMHVNEWARVNDEGQVELKYVDDALSPVPAAGMGVPPSAPVSPYSREQMIRRAFYETTELAGLVGWATQSIYRGVTGADFPFAEEAVMQPASEMNSMRKAFWGEQMGGAFLGIPLMSESVRRFLPAYPSAIESYNPISNKLPKWMPSDLRYGDPYTNIRYGLGEERLPGPVYDELYNVGEQGYTLPHRLQILSDVAHWSPQYRKEARDAISFMRGAPTDRASVYMAETMDRLARKRAKLSSDFYINKESGFGAYDSRGNITDINASTRQRGLIAATAGRAWESFIHGIGKVTAPLEHVGPAGISPWSKLVHQRDPIEHYEQTQVSGSQYRFWSHPYKNWIRPAIASAKRNWMGDTSAPGHVEERRDMLEYYDKLKWYKNIKLAQAAEAAGSNRAGEYRLVAQSTRFGVNPFASTSAVKYTLPYSDRPYFDTFSIAVTDESRSRILAAIPQEQHSIYRAAWQKKIEASLKAQHAQGIISDSGEATLAQIQLARKAEGRYITPELFAKYTDKAADGTSYADWSRMKEAEAFFASRDMPEPDWAGWSPAVDLEDVKLKQLQEEGKDFHEFGMFQSRVRMLGRKPYLDSSRDAGELFNRASHSMNSRDMMRRLRGTGTLMGVEGNIDYSYNSDWRSTDAIDLNISISQQSNIGDLFN